MERSMAILDKDISYGETLMQFLTRNGSLGMRIQIFSSIELFLAHVKEEKVEVLLVSERYGEDLVGLEDLVGRMILLQEEPGLEQKKIPGLYKYQSAHSLISGLSDLIKAGHDQEATSSEDNPDRKCIISCVFSPSGAVTTQWALDLCEYLGESAKVLYVNLHPFGDLSGRGIPKQKGMSEVLYYIKQKNKSLNAKWESLVATYKGCDILGPVAHYRDLFDLHKADVSEFLTYIRQNTEYEYMVCDVGVFGEGFPLLLQECEDIYIPQERQGDENTCYETFCTHIREDAGEEIIGKIKTYQMQEE